MKGPAPITVEHCLKTNCLAPSGWATNVPAITALSNRNTDARERLSGHGGHCEAIRCAFGPPPTSIPSWHVHRPAVEAPHQECHREGDTICRICMLPYLLGRGACKKPARSPQEACKKPTRSPQEAHKKHTRSPQEAHMKPTRSTQEANVQLQTAKCKIKI